MALSISTSSLLRTPSDVSNPGVNESITYISNPDHSLTFTTGNGACTFTYDADDGDTDLISYVGISGHNIGEGGVVTVYHGGTLVGTHTVGKRNNVIMITFTPQVFTSIAITVTPVSAGTPTTFSYIDGGSYLSIETGEQAGYKRNWLNRGLTQKTTSNTQGAPASSLLKRIPLTGTLSLPNELSGFSRDEWQDFIDYAYEYPFFVKEVESNAASSYVCFDPKFSTESHAQTLALDSLSVTFKAYNGL